MTIDDLRTAVDGLRAAMEKFKADHPEYAGDIPGADELASLSAMLSDPLAVAAFAKSIITELSDPSKFFTDPKGSPSNLAG